MASGESSHSKMSAPYLNMGLNTHEVPLRLFALNRARTVEALQSKEEVNRTSYILLQGGDNITFYNTDVDYTFRQESFFMWTFGVLEPGFFGAIEVKTGNSILFMPRRPDEYAIWMGKPPSLDQVKDKYQVDEVFYVDQMADLLTERTNELLLLNGLNTDSNLTIEGAVFEGIEKFKLNLNVLYPIMSELRVIKTEMELDVMRYVTRISSEAHNSIMLQIKPDMVEYQCEAMFLDHCYRDGGCRHVGYTCICGSGDNSSILHYGHAAAPNDKIMKDGDMALFDMGASYFGYSADITCSFPVNGKFTKDQKMIYEAVLAANMAVQNYCRAGLNWVDLHLLAGRVLCSSLTAGGLLQGDSAEMVEAGLNSIFQPHGLGHLLGLDVHDVGGYQENTPSKPTDENANKLRMARVLEAGMVITIEPGCYFIDALLDKALADPKLSKFMIPDEINRFRGFGGVRIEDDVIVHQDRVENITNVPRTVAEIEKFMASAHRIKIKMDFKKKPSD